MKLLWVHQNRHEHPVLYAGLIWLSAYLVARGLLEVPGLPPSIRVLVALAPVPLFAWFLWQTLDSVSRMDELVRRIHLEALALAFPLGLILLMTLGLLELAINLDSDNWSYRHVWAMLPTFYFFGLWRAKRRYS